MCADAEQAFYDDLYRGIVRKAGIGGVWEDAALEGVEITVREDAENTYFFAQNFGRQGVRIRIPEGAVLFGPADGHLAPLGGVVVRMKKVEN